MKRTTRSLIGSCLAGALFLSASVNAGPYAIQLRSVEMDAASGLVTLAWDAQNGKTYAIDETSDPRLGWEENVGGVQGYGSRMTTTILPRSANLGAKAMLFRVREVNAAEIENTEREIDRERALLEKRAGKQSGVAATEASLNKKKAATAAGTGDQQPAGVAPMRVIDPTGVA